MVCKGYSMNINISLSSPILVRTRCKYCNSLPQDCFLLMKKRIFLSPVEINNIYMKYITKYMIINSVPVHSNGRFIRVNRDLSLPVNYKAFNSSLHKNKKNSIDTYLSFTEVVLCRCGRSCWGVQDKTKLLRHEVLHRKSFKCYPKTFSILNGKAR